ncbi:hypothetical protein PHISCL_01566 [Aspergillus sclerotialis]|uniref:Integral membrane protein n=1 Tax=Aspergillus sclerotialis TaxID=2070753 RepID=A0A3A2ZUW3_9EURO|nr:hypothetical protein PHISCL_01566 [Aspergillus sclerotialis]
MSVPPIAKATLQAAVINAGSNILAQGITAVRDEKQFQLDLQALLQFTTCAFIVSPMTFLWLEGLESYFPGNSEEKDVKENRSKSKSKDTGSPKLNIKNTIAKIVIDQIIGGAWNTVLFIATMGMLRGMEYEAILEQIRNVRVLAI